jgi:hypothetical protein
MTTKSTGRAVALLLFVQLAAGLILPYVLLHPVSARPGAFLDSAAGMAGTLRLCVLMLFVGGAASLAVAVLAWPVVRERQPRLGLWLVALAAINFALQLVENAHWLTLLTISQAHASAGGGNPAAFHAVGAAAHAAFRWAHYSHILIVVAWLFTFFLLVWRAELAPRTIAAFGMGAAWLHFFGIILPAFGGYRMPLPDLFGAPLALAILALASWLAVRGFADRAYGEVQAR